MTSIKKEVKYLKKGGKNAKRENSQRSTGV